MATANDIFALQFKDVRAEIAGQYFDNRDQGPEEKNGLKLGDLGKDDGFITDFSAAEQGVYFDTDRKGNFELKPDADKEALATLVEAKIQANIATLQRNAGQPDFPANIQSVQDLLAVRDTFERKGEAPTGDEDEDGNPEMEFNEGNLNAQELEDYHHTLHAIDAMKFLEDKKRLDNLTEVYEKNVKGGTDEQKLNYQFLFALSDKIKNRFEFGEGANQTVMTAKPDGKLYLKVKNFEGSGMDFAVDDNQTLVLSDGQTLNPKQAEDLGRFFNESGLGDWQDIKFGPNSDKIKVKDETGKEEPFPTAFKRGMGWSEEDEKTPQISDEDFKQFLKDNNLISEPPPDDIDGIIDTAKGMNLSMSAMASKVKARMKIMGFMDNRLLHTRRMADGSIVICAYTTETDARHDSESKNGDVNRKKAFAVKVKIKNGVPTCSWYLPQGKMLEASHVQCMLEALKTQGCQYYKMPNAIMTGGKGQGAFWEATAKTLMVPVLKTEANPDGADLSPDNVHDLMEAFKKEINKHGAVEVLKFKEKFLYQLEQMEAFRQKEYEKKNPGKTYEPNVGMSNEIAGLQGALMYDRLKVGPLPALETFIKENAEGVDSQGHDLGAKRWDAVDVIVAYKALENILKPENYTKIKARYEASHDGKSPDADYLKMLLYKEMNCDPSQFKDAEGNSTEGPRAFVLSRIQKEFNGDLSNKNNPARRMDTALKNVAGMVNTSLNSLCTNIGNDYSFEMKLQKDALKGKTSGATPRRDEKTGYLIDHTDSQGNPKKRRTPMPPFIAKAMVSMGYAARQQG